MEWSLETRSTQEREYGLKMNNPPKLTHEARRVVGVCPNFVVNLDQTLHNNFLHIVGGKSVLQTIPQEDDEGQRLPQLVGTSAWSWCEHTTQLVEHP